MHTEEPCPIGTLNPWKPFEPTVLRTIKLKRPSRVVETAFSDVIEARRSRLGSSISWDLVGDLLWLAVGARGYSDAGRAGLPVQWSPTPSAGALAHILIIGISDDDSPPRLYDPIAHSWFELVTNQSQIFFENRNKVVEVLGACRGVTLRFLGDWSKLSAAYRYSESLLFRDAGALMATIGLCAEAVGLAACPLGFLGDNLVAGLGWPIGRFRAAGGIQIGSRPSDANTRDMDLIF